MIKFEMIQDKPKNTVFEATVQPTITVAGQTVKVGTHSGSFSETFSRIPNDDRFIAPIIVGYPTVYHQGKTKLSLTSIFAYD